MPGTVKLLLGDCIARLNALERGSIQAVVCDPPYDLTAVSKDGAARKLGSGPYGRHTLGSDTTQKPAKRG